MSVDHATVWTKLSDPTSRYQYPSDPVTVSDDVLLNWLSDEGLLDWISVEADCE